MMVMMMWLEHNEIMSIYFTFRLSKCNRLTIDEKILWILTQEYSYSIKLGHIYNWGSSTNGNKSGITLFKPITN